MFLMKYCLLIFCKHATKWIAAKQKMLQVNIGDCVKYANFVQLSQFVIDKNLLIIAKIPLKLYFDPMTSED